MMATPRVLVMDDDPGCLAVVCHLLRRAGYDCHPASNTSAAIETIRSETFDLLILDTGEPTPGRLQTIRQLAQLAGGSPMILTTGYPTLEVALEAFRLPVAAYLIKPVPKEELLQNVQCAMLWTRTKRLASRAAERLERSRRSLAALAKQFPVRLTAPSCNPLNAFAALTIEHVLDSILDLRALILALSGVCEVRQPCHLLECPRLHHLASAVAKAVAVLERTKRAFKSKELGNLRAELEQVLRCDWLARQPDAETTA